MMEYSIFVPTLNGGSSWEQAAHAIARQQPGPHRVLVIDSGSSDRTAEIAQELGFDVSLIDAGEFDHGGTRQKGVMQLAESEVIVFLTQDAILLSENSVALLLDAFANPEVGAAYGRQLPGNSTSLFERHARQYNYPAESRLKSRDSIEALGIKAAFCSNSFAAYRRDVLAEVGGFPERTLFAEDMMVAARMVLAGYSIAYVAEAEVEHWHDNSVAEEFRRSFDIGVFHRREKWILEKFGTAQGEGASLIITGLRKIGSERPVELPVAAARYAARIMGYLTGRAEAYLPQRLKRSLSMNRNYWAGDA